MPRRSWRRWRRCRRRSEEDDLAEDLAEILRLHQVIVQRSQASGTGPKIGDSSLRRTVF